VRRFIRSYGNCSLCLKTKWSLPLRPSKPEISTGAPIPIQTPPEMTEGSVLDRSLAARPTVSRKLPGEELAENPALFLLPKLKLCSYDKLS
jgi:hypothetical protein